jgi:hypothetical protein
MGTDWFVKVKCPRPHKEAKNLKEHINDCSGCPYVIWEEPESVAGFMNSMCGVRVGSIGIAADLDCIGETITSIERFTKTGGRADDKLSVLDQIKSHIESKLWTITGLTREETLEHLNLLIEFCKRADAKGLEIWAWA